MSVSVVSLLKDDHDLTIFNLAGLLQLYLHRYKSPIHNQHPVFFLLSSFLLRCVFGPSVRTCISNAETEFLLVLWLGSKTHWPSTFSDAYNFLRNWREFIQQFVIKSNVMWLWQHGFIFFGTQRTVFHAFVQLKLNTKERDNHMVIAAARHFFCRKDEARSTRHLSYYLYSNNSMTHLSTKYLPLYSMMPVVCASGSTEHRYSIVRQRIKDETPAE